MFLSRQKPRTIPQPILTPAPTTPAPRMMDVVNVDGFAGLIVQQGHEGQPSPIWGDPTPAVRVSGPDGEWSLWLHVTQLEPDGNGWKAVAQ